MGGNPNEGGGTSTTSGEESMPQLKTVNNYGALSTRSYSPVEARIHNSLNASASAKH